MSFVICDHYPHMCMCVCTETEKMLTSENDVEIC